MSRRPASPRKLLILRPGKESTRCQACVNWEWAIRWREAKRPHLVEAWANGVHIRYVDVSSEDPIKVRAAHQRWWDAHGGASFRIWDPTLYTDGVGSSLLSMDANIHLIGSAQINSDNTDREDETLVRARADGELFRSAVTEAIDEHHRAGRAVVVRRDGHIVRIEPPSRS